MYHIESSNEKKNQNISAVVHAEIQSTQWFYLEQTQGILWYTCNWSRSIRIHVTKVNSKIVSQYPTLLPTTLQTTRKCLRRTKRAPTHFAKSSAVARWYFLQLYVNQTRSLKADCFHLQCNVSYPVSSSFGSVCPTRQTHIHMQACTASDWFIFTWICTEQRFAHSERMLVYLF